MKREPFKLIWGRDPFVTVAEMRLRHSAGGDGRIGGSTTPEIVPEFCPKEKPILEIGPEKGAFTKWLKDNGYRSIYTLDLVDTLKDKSGITSHIGDLNVDRYPYTDGFFGSAISWGVIEHLENPHHFIREAHRIVEQDGIFIVAIPNVLHLKSRLHLLVHGFFQRWNVKDNHVALFPHGVFEKSFLRYFDLVKVLYTKPSWDLYTQSGVWYLPKNVWFGNYVVYVLRKKKFVPFSQ